MHSPGVLTGWLTALSFSLNGIRWLRHRFFCHQYL